MASFKPTVPVEVRRPRFKLSTAVGQIDPARLARKARVEPEVGRFEGDGCGRIVTAEVRKGTVTRLLVTPCADVKAIPSAPALRALLSAARREVGAGAAPARWRPIPFTVLQQQAGDITIKTITCVQICIFGHCFVCCTLPQGGFFCGSRVIIHTP